MILISNDFWHVLLSIATNISAAYDAFVLQ